MHAQTHWKKTFSSAGVIEYRFKTKCQGCQGLLLLTRAVQLLAAQCEVGTARFFLPAMLETKDHTETQQYVSLACQAWKGIQARQGQNTL